MRPSLKEKQIFDTQSVQESNHISKTERKTSSLLHYEGNTQNGIKHGVGVLKSGNQVIYSGKFAFGQREGQGQSFTGTQIYSGNWKKNLQHGIGKVQYQNGDFYKGNFKSGQKQGFGICKEGNTFFVGQWESGLKLGEFLSFCLSSGSAYEIWYENNTAVYKTRLNQLEMDTSKYKEAEVTLKLNQGDDLKDFLHKKIREIKDILQSQSSEIFTESKSPKTSNKSNNNTFYSGE